MKVKIVKEVKRSDGLWRFACGDVFHFLSDFQWHHPQGFLGYQNDDTVYTTRKHCSVIKDWNADDDIPCYQLQWNHIRSCTLTSLQAIQLQSWLTIWRYTPLSYNYIIQLWHYHPRAVPSYRFLEEFCALKVHILNYTVTLKHVNSKSLTQWVIGDTLHYHCQRVQLETLKWRHCPLSATVETRHTDGDTHTHSARYRFVSSLNFSSAFSYIWDKEKYFAIHLWSKFSVWHRRLLDE